MKSLITGYGFVGKHLEAELKKQKKEVYIMDIKNGVDIRDYEKVRNFLDIVRPDEIYHLAAQAYVPESFSNPQRTFEVNAIGSINLLESVKNLGLKCRIHLAGTSEEYGDATPKGDKVTEEDFLNPLSPYAISKISMELMGKWYRDAYGLKVVTTRAYNHGGPGRGEQYAESSFAKQIVEIEKGTRNFIEHGNLESIRNYTDVRDIVRAYTMAINLPSGTYNICSENNVTMQEILDILIKNSKCKVETRVNKALYRPSDFSFYPPSCEKFTKLTNWKPEVSLEKMLVDILKDWRKKL